MIFFLSPAASTFTLENYLGRSDAAAVAGRIRVLTYEALFGAAELPLGSYILTGLDQLTPAGSDLVSRCRDALRQAAPEGRILNDPGRVLHRYELLRNERDAGRNRFGVSRAPGLLRRRRYPVFLRCEREHSGSLSPLITSAASLNRELLLAWVRGYRMRDLLIVEFCDTSDTDGIFRKYSAFVVGDQIIPRSLIRSRDWVTKDQDRDFSNAAVAEELEYVSGNPHEHWLREVFRSANVEYGRIDYGLLNGEPQLWEINLAPTIGGPQQPRPGSTRTVEQRRLTEPARRLFYRRFAAALERLDSPVDSSRTVSVPISESESARLNRELRDFERVRARRTLVSRLFRPSARRLKRLAAGAGRARGLASSVD